MLELLKVMVQPVLLERDEDGNIVGEKFGETTALYTPFEVARFVEAIGEAVTAENAKSNGALDEGAARRVRTKGKAE